MVMADDGRIAKVVRFAEETLSPPPLSSAQFHAIGTKPALESPILLKAVKVKSKSPKPQLGQLSCTVTVTDPNGP
ncbi:291_t:CDS:2 [Ambispora leptoticha]|uniref:291_t:CDS:1 n=1 Tax=Ambispora leptoticha TaxID=144679 RepID=A0A9N9A1V9_9GLOM|nr:291_t:CDS:2 [Ambispora leptoticha]